jgi:hypothetical protein
VPGPTITPQKLLLAEGSLYRLARPPQVTKGQWYFIVTCKGCSKPIYLVNDPFNGVDPHRFVGSGQISTPCTRCRTDTTYSAQEVSSIQSAEDIAARTPSRREPSNMSRQPIATRYPNVKPTFGPGFLEDRPQAAALVARCVALWTEVEVQLANLLAEMLRANTEPAIALFLTIQNSRIQGAVLDAVAQVVLTDAKEYELFCALMNYRKSVEKERNDLAHGCFGGADEIAEGVAWIDPIHLTSHGIKMRATGVTSEAISSLRSKTFVYELADLETVACNIEDLHKQLGFFSGYLFSYRDGAQDGPSWRAMRYPQLCAEPRIAQELSKFREGQKRT